MHGFKNFLLRGDVIVIAVGLIVALAFSTLIGAFTTNVDRPDHRAGRGQQLHWPWLAARRRQ